ncbi:hypothetical protein WICANDRAFT_92613 [Wickerhamomyces anomalus NRRL Y-366-8]|uniref:DNA-directed RNA polymerase n=1 Tax=Wickerhamomyces anomalus (strain ATCC 58044 / CBS 1984 / NCYC 433 / NRRL Y-366-8) TaxID=683960 RepID=A0A1E3P5W0_WICAA|nr:uncharacterized protein WICANDRAFT_92613 [Wickerhamomyces anomalus NRRL Y-366-8]ODQ60322.1 hypothetical protein WICANDRAFT_92613 [Wickerhamomyces anomalus NRRL Y-366-8]
MLRAITKNRYASRLNPSLKSVIKRANSTEASLIHRNIIHELRHIPAANDMENRTGAPLADAHQESWSSPYDKVFRQSHSKDVMRLWSLLDVCLDSQQFDRAENILEALYQLSIDNDFSFMDDLNKFLWKRSQDATQRNLDDYIKTWSKNFHVSPNARTYAILISAAMNNGAPYRKYSNQLIGKADEMTKVLGNVDVFGVKNLKAFVSENAISPRLVPQEYRYLLEDVRTDDGEGKQNFDYFEEDSTELPPTLAKANAKELVAVDTFGMKVIRHTLLSLKPHLQTKLFDDLNEKLEGKFNFLTSTSEDTTNFFNIYKTLSPEHQRIFESALDDFNVERQSQLESRSFDAAQERWRHDFEELTQHGTLNLSKNLNARLWSWYEAMKPIVKEEIELCKEVDNVNVKDLSRVAKAQHNERVKYAPYLRLLDPNKTTVITILELLKNNSTGGIHEGMRTARAVVSVAKALELEFRSDQLLNSEKNMFKGYDKKTLARADLKKYAATMTAFKSEKLGNMNIVWPQDVRVKLGSVLVSILMHVAKVEVTGVDPITKNPVKGEAPAFYHSYQYHNGAKIGILKIHKALGAHLSADKLVGAVQPQMLPMLVKPRQWTAWNNGGYYYSQNLLVRSRDSPEQLAYLKASTDRLDLVYEGLNVLGETAWTVNERVYKVMSEIWNTGETFLDIPKDQEEMNVPDAPPKNSDPSVINDWKQKVRRLQNEFATNRSMRCDANYKLEIARAYLGEKFYFPHNVDFRGRAYPLSPNFNHMGNDLSRGLLIFWKGKELGDEGLRWLKIHLSNLFGIDKAPLEERVAFADENLENIKKTAEDPMANKEFWTKADKPWQALATIYDLADAYKLEDPTKHISHQPVHQDGTCNGLQHYAALGGDVEGATQVNLVPADRPQDVYTHVAGLVTKRLEAAAAKGDEMAETLKDKIKRKVVKQTVMTNVYGVTYIGATHQIHKQLQDVFDDTESYKLSTYLAKHVFACMRELFEGAHLIQDWLALCAKMISRSIRIDVDTYEVINQKNKPAFMASVIWTTPLNLPIVQPYRAVVKKQVSTNLQTVFISDPFEMHQVDSRKQMAAFPPNFIHSLDASHMLLSAISCRKEGLEFAAVHDSYWTHASDVKTMGNLLREAFIGLHEVDLVSKLKQEFDQRYHGFLQLVEIPLKSSVGAQIMEQRKKLSKELGRPVTLGDEVYIERKRQNLLNSTEPEEVEEGKAMVTTVSLIEDVDVEKLATVKELNKIENSIGTEDEDLSIVKESAVSSGKQGVSKIRVFAPLRLPEIPPKGQFDVQDLRESKYFFS